jgi:hypothetical protein
VVTVSSLGPGDEELHYSDGSHRWMCPWLNASEVDETAWSRRMHAHRDAHRSGMTDRPASRPARDPRGGAWRPMSTHVPVRPSWTCGGCVSAWPCETRRVELLAEYTDAPVSLALHLSACLVDATGDLPHALAGDLHARFIGWLRLVEADDRGDAEEAARCPCRARPVSAITAR